MSFRLAIDWRKTETMGFFTAYRELKTQLKAIEAMSAADAIDLAKRNAIAIPASAPGTPTFEVWRKYIVWTIRAAVLNDQKLAKKAANAADFYARPPDYQQELIDKLTRGAANAIEKAKNAASPTYLKPYVERFKIADAGILSRDHMAVSWAIQELAAIMCELKQPTEKIDGI